MTDTANLGLPCIEAAQAQKHVTHNEALRLLDTMVQLAVLDRDLAAPPGAPAEGQRWIVASSPTDAWAGHATHIAAWQDGGWQFSVPQIGWVAYVIDEGTLVTWNGSAWGDFFSTVTALQNLAMLGIGATADTENPLSAKLNNVLWTAKTPAEGGTGDLRYKLSKAASANTLSLLFQDDFSGRAEIGLTGDDNLHVKVSADGATWIDAIAIDASTGALSAAGAISANGGQIAFPSTQNASANPNTLDDYEEGTFTPSLQFGGAGVGIAYTTQNGNYTKIGNLVVVRMQTTLSSKGTSTGLAAIAGLPFVAAATGSVSIWCSGVTATGSTGVVGFIQGSQVRIWANSAQLTDAAFSNSSNLVITAIYLAST